jgi:LemA protein
MSFEIWAAILGLAVVVPAALLYNRLANDRNQARQRYAEIDAHLKRRADLVPRLVEVAARHAAQEKAVLGGVTELHAAALAAANPEQRFAQERALGEGLKQLIVLQQAYPQLKADAGFRDLQSRLVEIEEQLQYARRSYNDAVTRYASRLESFPDVIVGTVLRFESMPAFEP